MNEAIFQYNLYSPNPLFSHFSSSKCFFFLEFLIGVAIFKYNLYFPNPLFSHFSSSKCFFFFFLYFLIGLLVSIMQSSQVLHGSRSYSSDRVLVCDSGVFYMPMDTNSFNCDDCKERGYGPHYRCESCNFDLHKECYLPSLTIHSHGGGGGGRRRGYKFDFIPKFPCPPTPSRSLLRRFCDACGRPILGSFYHCEDRGQDLHPCCINLHRKITFTDTYLSLITTNVAAGSSACFHCKKTTLWKKNKGVPGWSYVSASGKYWCHVYCLMEMEREMRRRGSLETPRLGAPRTRRATGESWWEFLSNSISLIQLITGADPITVFIDTITGG